MKLNSKNFEVFRMLFSVLIALLISFIVIFMLSEQPLTAIRYLITGPFTNKRNLGNVFEVMIPLVFTGTGVCIMFAANSINLATDGAFHLGGLVAATIVLQFSLPTGINWIVALAAASLCGALFCMIPAIMKIKLNAPELVSSLMLNYISLNFCMFIMMYFLRDPAVGSASYKMPANAELPTLVPQTNVHVGLILCLLVAAFGYVFLYKTKIGYELRLTGENGEFAKYSGINIIKVILISQLVGGIIAGFGGGIEILSPIYNRFSWTDLLGYGWDAIVVCTLAKKNPKYVPLAALFLAYLRTGSSIMARYTDVTLELVQITQGIIILLVGAEQFLSGLRHKIIAKEARAELENAQKGGAL